MARHRYQVGSMLNFIQDTRSIAQKYNCKLTTLLLVACIAFCIALHGALAQSPPPSSPINPINWEMLSNGLEVSRFQIASGGLLGSSAVAVRAPFSKFMPRTIRAAEYGWKKGSAQALCQASGASACINSNFFDEQGKPLGIVIGRGIQHQKLHRGGGTLTGVFFATSHTLGITHRSLFSAEKVIEAAQAGPRLISDGAPVIGVKDSANATNISLVCIDRDQRILFVRASLALFGGSLRELQITLLRPELGCVDALNFDGGGSSQLYFAGNSRSSKKIIHSEFLPGRDEVPVVLGLTAR